ncbi:hypothetical protein [Flavobacterium sp.]|jgi:hypothetical protein|uniref:hypothetical protein n=1 Tax=Flavobacterium sp. TaxID=239 RepID=UPI0037BF9BB1
MKNLFFSAIAMIAFSATSFAQCDEQSTLLTTECGQTCVSVMIPTTGILEVDIRNMISSNNTMRRKPSLRELVSISQAIC